MPATPLPADVKYALNAHIHALTCASQQRKAARQNALSAVNASSDITEAHYFARMTDNEQRARGYDLVAIAWQQRTQHLLHGAA